MRAGGGGGGGEEGGVAEGKVLGLCFFCCDGGAVDVEGDGERGFGFELVERGFEGETVGGVFGVVFLRGVREGDGWGCGGGTLSSFSTMGTLKEARLAKVRRAGMVVRRAVAVRVRSASGPRRAREVAARADMSTERTGYLF